MKTTLSRRDEEKERAIQFLARQIPSEILADVRMVMQNKQTPWHQASHFSFGLRVRNSIREADFKFDDVWLDEHWFELVEEAVTQSSQT